MKILIDAVGIRGHGAAKILQSLLNEFSELKPDWQFYIYLYPKHLLEFEISKTSDNVLVTNLDFVTNFFRRMYWINKRLSGEVKKLNIDVILSFANIGSSNPSVPQIVFLHQANIFQSTLAFKHLKKRLKFYFMQKLVIEGIKKSNHVLVQTKDMANKLIKINSQFEKIINVIPSGYTQINGNLIVDPKLKLLISKTTYPRLVYISHPSEHKNHLNLIKAFAEICKTHSNACLLLTLAQDSNNKRYRKFVDTIKSLVLKLGIESNVYFLGNINHDEVYYTLQNSDMMVYPSLTESFGLGLVEAMYMKCPIAASDLPYAHEVARDAAVYFDPLEPISISETIIKLLSNKEILDKLKDNAEKEIIRFDYKIIAGRIINLLEQTKKI